MIDLQLVDKGQDYDTLNNSYIIFICLSGLFGKDRYMYTFENVCEEDSEVILDDGPKKVFLNADGKNGTVSEELKAFLDYVAGRPSEDTFVKKLKRAVEKEYMTLLMCGQENPKIGEKCGEKRWLDYARYHSFISFPNPKCLIVCSQYFLQRNAGS